MKKLEGIFFVALVFVACASSADVYDVRSFGATGKGVVKDTAAIQRTLDACARTGGRVVVPAGRYLIGSIYLGDNTELHLEDGATLLGSPDLSDYNAPDAYPQNWGSVSEGWSAKHLVLALERHNVSITGKGTIDGNGRAFFADKASFTGKVGWRHGGVNARGHRSEQRRPGQEIVFIECDGVTVRDVTFRDMSCWSCFFYGCTNVTVGGVTVRNGLRNLNTDGFDVDSCRNVQIGDCDILTGDDAIAIRGSPARLKDPTKVCENIRVSNIVCRVSADGVRVGVGNGTIRNVRVSNMTIKESGRGLHVQCCYGRPNKGTKVGVDISDVEFSDISIRDTCEPVCVMAGASVSTAHLKDIVFRNVRSESFGPVVVSGGAVTRPSGVRFENCDFRLAGATENSAVDSETGEKDAAAADGAFRINSAEKVVFRKCRLEWGADTPRNIIRAFAVCDSPSPDVDADSDMKDLAAAREESMRLKARDVTLARRGFPADCTIVLPKEPSDSQRYAAEELRDYIRKITGAELPIATIGGNMTEKAIVIDGKTDPDLGDDGFRLVAEGQRIRIVGSSARGCLYGAYELLEKFGGVRWFASWHEVVPKSDRFSVPASLDQREKPAIPARDVFWCDPLGNAAFAARLRLNRRSWRNSDAKYGGNVLRFSGRLGTCHTFNTLVPPSKYFATHPEYYSEVDGKRLGERTQLCLTNPDVLEIVISNVVAEIARSPSAEVFGVSQNDWYNNCTCASCKALDDREGSPAGSMIAFVNKVAEAVARLRPGKRIETLAYQYTRRPPKTLAPRPDVMICLCSIECDFGRPIASSTYAENVKFRDDIRIWSERSKDLYIWDYTTDFNHFLLPFPNIPVLQDNVRFFRDNKAFCVFEQGAYKGWHGEFAELKAWLLAKWLWNPELDRAKLVDEFLAGYYGDAAPFVKMYLTELEAGWKVYGGGKLGCFAAVGDMSKVFAGGFLARAQELWQKAEDAVQNDPAYRYNVRMGMLPILYLRSQGECSRWNMTRQVIKPSEAAQRFLAYYDEAARAGRRVRICESNKKDAARLENLRAAAAVDALAPTSHIRIAAGKLSRSGPPNACRDVDDPAAEWGKAVFLANDNYQWYTTFPLSSVAFEPGVKYTLRIRLRADVTGKPGEVVQIGVHDYLKKRGRGCLSLNAKRLKDGYAWYDVLTWEPDSRNQTVYIAPGWFNKKTMGASAAHNGVWLDSIEIVRQ